MTKSTISIDAFLLYLVLGFASKTVYASSYPVDNGTPKVYIVMPIVLFIIIVIICWVSMCTNRPNVNQDTNSNKHRTTTMAIALAPRLVTAAATKSEPNTSVGLSFTGKDHAKISSINADSIFNDSALDPGMKVVSINNTPISSAVQAVVAIQEANDVVTILAHSPGHYGPTENLVTATAKKESPGQDMGVVYAASGCNSVEVSVIKKSSLLQQTEITPGMKIVAINNIVAVSPSHGKTLSRAAFPLVTLLARRSSAVAVAMYECDHPVPAVATVLVDSPPLPTTRGRAHALIS